MIFGTIRIGPFPELFFDLTAAALTGFAAIGLLQATQNRIARAGLTFVAMITLFEAISALLPPSGHPWIAVIRIMPSLYLPAIVAHAMVAIADQLEWGNVHRSWIRTFQLAGFLALAGSAFVIWRAVEGRVVADSFSPHSGAEYTAVILAVGFGLWMIVQYLSSIVRSLNQVRTDLDAEKLALSTPE